MPVLLRYWQLLLSCWAEESGGKGRNAFHKTLVEPYAEIACVLLLLPNAFIGPCRLYGSLCMSCYVE